MAEPLSLQLILAEQLNWVLQAIHPQASDTPFMLRYQLRWGRSPSRISYICNFSPDVSLHHRQSLARMALALWEDYWGVARVSWVQALAGHCLRQILPSGQVLFTPEPLGLGAWLWHLAISKQDFEPCPQSGLLVSPASPNLHLAQQLQLSPQAVVDYIHGRCSQLLTIALARSGVSPAFLSRDDCSPMELYSDLFFHVSGQSMLYSLVHLIDCLTLLPPAQEDRPDPHCFAAAYGLAVAVDGWLAHGHIPIEAPSTITLLQVIERVLGIVLQTNPEPSPLA